MANKAKEATINNLISHRVPETPDVFLERDSETAEVKNELLRALRRKKGFGLFFVQCNPAQGQQLIEAISKRFPEKRIEKVELSEQSETLYGELIERYKNEAFEIVCISGIEQALYKYEDTKRLGGWSWEEVYSYSWKGVPPLLSHLNRQREAFEANLPIALIFFVPSFVIDYFVQRSPDFFDWRSGFFKLSESSEELKKASQELIDKGCEEYLLLTPDQTIEKILEIKGRVLQLQQSDCKQSSSLLREQGRLFESVEEHIKALDCYNRAIAFSPDNYKALNSSGLLLENLKRYAEAVTHYEAATSIKPDYYLAWSSKGDVLKELGRYDESIESYDHALEINPDYFYTWAFRGDALEKLERYEEALESYDRALEINPDHNYVWSRRGHIFEKLERYEEALESYEHALTIDPDHPYIWGYQGHIFEKLERYEEALESYDCALETNSDNFYTWSFRGDVLRELERYEEALESYDRVLEIKPDYFYAWVFRGVALEKLGRYEEALESYDRALEINSDNCYTWSLRGDALSKLGRYEEALESYGCALEIDPDQGVANK